MRSFREPLSADELARYRANAPDCDAEIRKLYPIPADRYFTVTIWPEARAGLVHVSERKRVVPAKKISKSDQPQEVSLP